MMNNIIFLKPILVHKSWGKNDLGQFGYKENEKDTGELILLSDGDEFSNQVINTQFHYDDINFLYRHNKKFFNSKTGNIPITIKIINPKEDLDLLMSVDSKNSKFFSTAGTEIVQNKLWISLSKDKQIITYNHNCHSLKSLEDFITTFNDKYLNHVELDYLNSILINQNIINRIKKNNIIYQISCKNGLEIDLNQLFSYELEKFSYDYLTNAWNNTMGHVAEIIASNKNYLTQNQYFATKIIDHVGLEYYTFDVGNITHIFIIEGQGKIDSFNISTGSNFIVKNNISVQIVGAFKMIVTHIFDR